MRRPSSDFGFGLEGALNATPRGTLIELLEDPYVQEAVWLVAALPIALTLAATLRLMQLLAKKQLAHAFLDSGFLLTTLLFEFKS